jgi:hypothetical protein
VSKPAALARLPQLTEPPPRPTDTTAPHDGLCGPEAEHRERRRREALQGSPTRLQRARRACAELLGLPSLAPRHYIVGFDSSSGDGSSDEEEDVEHWEAANWMYNSPGGSAASHRRREGGAGAAEQALVEVPAEVEVALDDGSAHIEWIEAASYSEGEGEGEEGVPPPADGGRATSSRWGALVGGGGLRWGAGPTHPSLRGSSSSSTPRTPGRQGWTPTAVPLADTSEATVRHRSRLSWGGGGDSGRLGGSFSPSLPGSSPWPERHLMDEPEPEPGLIAVLDRRPCEWGCGFHGEPEALHEHMKWCEHRSVRAAHRQHAAMHDRRSLVSERGLCACPPLLLGLLCCTFPLVLRHCCCCCCCTRLVLCVMHRAEAQLLTPTTTVQVLVPSTDEQLRHAEVTATCSSIRSSLVRCPNAFAISTGPCLPVSCVTPSRAAALTCILISYDRVKRTSGCVTP